MIAATTFAPLVSFIVVFIVTVKISACTGFSSPSTTQLAAQQRVLKRRSRRCGHYTLRRVRRRPQEVQCPNRRGVTASPSALAMSLFDDLRSRFLDSRVEGDFVPLARADSDAFGPGPLVLLYAVPTAMDDAELRDMVTDGMPRRADVVIRRLSGMDEDGEGGDGLLDATVGEALAAAMAGGTSASPDVFPKSPSASPPSEVGPCPVLYFSGVSNSEMMDTYGILSNEIYEETRGVHWPACAKVVPPAMGKSMRQVLTEISGDHADAMLMRRKEAERTEEI